MYKSEFEFLLRNSKIEYANDGDTLTAVMLQLKAPTRKQIVLGMQLKQAFMQAIKDNMNLNTSLSSSVPNNNKDEAIRGQDIMAMLYMSSVDLSKIINIFRELLANVCFVDGKIAILPYMIDAISLSDMESLLGDYLANFIISSLMGNS